MRALSPDDTQLVTEGSEAHLASGMVRALGNLVAAQGADRETFLREAGAATQADLSGPSQRLPWTEFVRLVELAIDLTGHEDLGLRWVESTTLGAFVAPVSNLVVHCTTMEQALELAARFYKVFCNRCIYTVVESGAGLSLRMRDLECEPSRVRNFISETLVGGFMRVLRHFDPTAITPTSFAYPAPVYHTKYTELFGETAFEQPFTGFDFSPGVLSVPSPSRDDEYCEALLELAEVRLRRVEPSCAWEVRVRELLVRRGIEERLGAGDVARTLGISERTLRHKLASENTSYGRVWADARHHVAKRLLRDPDASIQEVADALGFSDTSTFHRAFRRWGGLTPGAYRSAFIRSSS